MSIYRLWRQDDNGNRFPVGTFSDRGSAEERLQALQRGVHKQMYWISEEAGNGDETMSQPRHIVVVGCLIRNRKDEILLIRHPRRGWEIPQGRVEEGEDLLAAAHREILEETGVRVELGPLAAVWSKLTPPSAVVFNFLATWHSGDLRSSDESPELGWFAAEAALGAVSHPVNRDRLKALLSFSGEIVYRSYSPKPYRVHGQAHLS